MGSMSKHAKEGLCGMVGAYPTEVCNRPAGHDGHQHAVLCYCGCGGTISVWCYSYMKLDSMGCRQAPGLRGWGVGMGTISGHIPALLDVRIGTDSKG
jgi:hypothetical protein